MTIHCKIVLRIKSYHDLGMKRISPPAVISLICLFLRDVREDVCSSSSENTYENISIPPTYDRKDPFQRSFDASTIVLESIPNHALTTYPRPPEFKLLHSPDLIFLHSPPTPDRLR